MIIVMEAGAPREHIDKVIEAVRDLGYRPHPIIGEERTVVAAVGDERGKERIYQLDGLPSVERVLPILQPYKLAGTASRSAKSLVDVAGVPVGRTNFTVIAGPCSVEGRDQILEAAEAVKAAGAQMLRGGAFKPRTSPYSFQGMGEEGLKLLAEARERTGLRIVTEAMTTEHVDLVADYADVIQVGARNMQNYFLLSKLGSVGKPVLLKRGLSSTVQELLMSAEYILSQGNYQVILCERGIRTFETSTRNTLDINAVAVLQRETHLPIFVDPSHATGHWELVEPIARAAVASGCDGLIIEVHPHPENAVSDGHQSLRSDKFAQMMDAIRPYIGLGGRTLTPSAP